MLVNLCYYFKGKSLSSHSAGVFGIAKPLNVVLDPEAKAQFFHPDTNQIMYTRTLIITDHLGKHGGKDTITDGSSQGLEGFVLPEIGRSWEEYSFNDYAFYIK